jgi:aureolysin
LLIFYLIYETKDVNKTQVRSESDAENFLKEYLIKNSYPNGSEKFKVLKKETDDLGITHYTLRQKVHKVFSEDIEIKIHTNKQGKILLTNGNIKSIKNEKMKIENEVKISSEIAANNAISFIGLQDVKLNNGNNKIFRSKNLVIQNNRYVYKMDINTMKPLLGHWEVNVDAETGEVLNKDQIDRVRVKGSDVNEIKKTVEIKDSKSKDQNIYCYENHKRGCLNISKNEKNQVLKNINSTVRYFKDTFNRDSFDDNNGKVVSIINVNLFNGKSMKNNAGWIGDKFIFGLSDGKIFNDLYKAKDIIAHEFTHALTQYTAALEYEDESGALNESFSDVFAYFIDHENWLIGEDIFFLKGKENALRSLSDPEKYGQPSQYKDYIYIDSDNGGIHINSGIPNKVAYRTIKKIGIEKSQHIYYRALTLYLSKHSDFKDAKISLVQASQDLYGSKIANEVKKAWEQTGIK